MNNNYLNQPLLYIDILGFSNRILSQSLDVSVLYYQQILDDIHRVTKVTKDFKVNFDVVSDSAFIWIDGEDLKQNTEKLFNIASVLLHNGLLQYRPLRGAIIFDEFIIGDRKFTLGNKEIQTHLILGKAIINGYRWEQNQDWFGISVNPFYTKIFKEKLPGLLEELIESHLLALYNLPTKTGEIKSYAVNGYYKTHHEGFYHDERLKEGGFSCPTYWDAIDHLKNDTKDFAVLNKLTNTEKFIERIAELSFWRPQMMPARADL